MQLQGAEDNIGSLQNTVLDDGFSELNDAFSALLAGSDCWRKFLKKGSLKGFLEGVAGRQRSRHLLFCMASSPTYLFGINKTYRTNSLHN